MKPPSVTMTDRPPPAPPLNAKVPESPTFALGVAGALLVAKAGERIAGVGIAGAGGGQVTVQDGEAGETPVGVPVKENVWLL